jgi:hypothetical protein
VRTTLSSKRSGTSRPVASGWWTWTWSIRELRARGLSVRVAAQVAVNGRRWWKNSAMAIHIAFPIRYFDELGVPRLAA